MSDAVIKLTKAERKALERIRHCPEVHSTRPPSEALSKCIAKGFAVYQCGFGFYRGGTISQPHTSITDTGLAALGPEVEEP